MDNDGAPTLEVGFAIETNGAFAEILRFSQMFDQTTVDVIKQAAAIERATGGMVSMGAATSGMRSFGAAATRELETVRQATLRTEKSGEAMVRQLERQNAEFGKTREQIRATKVETLALAAAEQGNTELAGRLRAEMALLQKQTNEAAEAAHRDAAAVRDASAAYQQFEARVREGVRAMREKEAADKAAAASTDAYVAKLNAETAAIGRTAAELRAMEIAQRAAAADAAGAPDQANRIRAAGAAYADAQAKATGLANAERQLAAEHDRLAAAVRGSHDAQVADAAAAERLRMATDPLYAATSRLNAEIAESTRLYYAGATPQKEYARQQGVLTGRLNELTRAHDAHAAAGRRGSSSMTQLSFQINDVATMAAMGAAPFQIFASQIGQIVQVAQMAEGGVKGFAGELGRVALMALPFAAAASVAGVAAYRWKEQIDDDAGLKKFAGELGLTQKEMKKLGDQSITTGDIMSGLWKTISEGAGLGGTGKSIMDQLFSPDDATQVQGFAASIYGFFAGGYDAIVELWSNLSSTVSGYISAMVDAASRFFAPVVAAAQWAGDAVGAIFNRVYQWVAGWVKSVAGFLSPVLSAIGEGPAATAISKAGNAAGKSFGEAYAKRVAGFVASSNAIAGRVGANTVDAAQARLKKKADEMIADRTPKAPKVDRAGERLARESEAIEAQIKNLYALAEAYGVSGAAALMAEARVKAESKAIKQRGDIEAAVAREIRLEVAKRVSDAAKTTATMNDQAKMQRQVNAEVAAGSVPAERAAELLRDRLADLPLLAAQEAARNAKDAKGLVDTTKALDAQRKARVDLTNEEREYQRTTAMANGANRIAEMNEEIRLIGATDAVRVKALATLRAEQDARSKGWEGKEGADYVRQQVEIAGLDLQRQLRADAFNDSLRYQADLLDAIAQNMQAAGQGIAEAFGAAGRALGDIASGFTGYLANQQRLKDAREAEMRIVAGIGEAETRARREREVSALYAVRNATAQIGLYGDLASSAKGFFKEGSKGYKAVATAEKAFRAVEMAMAIKSAAVQLGLIGGVTTARVGAAATGAAADTAFTGTSVANSGLRAAADGVAAVAKAIASLPFPLNIAAGAATAAVLASIGIAVAGAFGGGGKNNLPKANTGTGTTLGDAEAKSESITRAIEQLREVDSLTATYARQMSHSLRSIESQIGGFAALVTRQGDINASQGVTEGFKPNAIGSILSKIPLIGGFLGGLFGSKTSVQASGLYGGPQSVGSIMGSGFDASTYSDVKKTSKFLGITTGTKYSTQYGQADPGLENQFTLILRQFNDAIVAAAGPLGVATTDIQNKLNGFVINIGKVDLQGKTGVEIQEELTAIFGAAADNMANAAFPGMQQFQKVGEGLFETLVRVASTVEAVTNALGQLGPASQSLSMAAKLGLADQFDSLGDMSSAIDGYFEAFYTKEEQNAAKLAKLTRVFDSLGVATPETLAGYRALVDAQNLNTAAGQATYATLLQLAPAFADLKTVLDGVGTAADIAAEKLDLERKLLELRGDTAALRALDLAKLDVSNRPLQQQIWALQDAQEAANAADELRKAWSSVGDSIMDEVKRIRGLTGTDTAGGFAAIMGQFNAANTAARAGDQEAAKALPGLSQALITAAAANATSRQELDRVQAQTAATLEATYGAVSAMTGAVASTKSGQMDAVGAAAQATQTPSAANDDLKSEIRALKDEFAAMRAENNAGHAATAGNTGRVARHLDNVTGPSGGDAIAVVALK